ncbi:DUF5305 family protein [Halovenus salina]|uniref:DUF5305 family protein n=1 Tax=Halovenus salina TaxID=1510225 RepID=UPI002260D8BB|nr:DUF5305 family protein [Halovenus salina]
MRYASRRDEVDEWITTGKTPTAGDTSEVEVDDIERLVDVAIDTNQRVIEDSRTGTLSVQTPTTIYRYVPPAAAVSGGKSEHEALREANNGHAPTEELVTTATTDGNAETISMTDGQSADQSAEQGEENWEDD